MRRAMAALAAAVLAAMARGGEPAVGADPVVAALDTMIQDEYRTEAEYRRVLRDLGPTEPFTAYADAERNHAEMIGTLYERRGLPVPASAWTLDRVPGHRSRVEACAAAARHELRSAEMYDRFLDAGLPGDVRHVFRHNRNVAKHGHLPALRACAGLPGDVAEIPGEPAARPGPPQPLPSDKTRVRAPAQPAPRRP